MTSMGQSSLLSKAFLRIMASSHMSPNRRKFPNIIATHGRSLYTLVCGVFVGRWVVAALGSGLCGVVGGMMVIELLAGAMRRGRVVFAAGDRQ